MEKEYINLNNPVYISYAWANSEHPDIEEDVENICKLLETNHIYYKQDKKNLCPYLCGSLTTKTITARSFGKTYSIPTFSVAIWPNAGLN